MEKGEGEKPVFYLYLTEAWPFRHAYSNPRNILTKVTLTFTRNGITFVQKNEGDYVLVHTTIYADKIQQYEFNGTEDQQEQYSLQCSLQDLVRALQSILKKGSLRMYHYEGDNCICCLPSTKDGEDPILYCHVEPGEQFNFDPIPYGLGNEFPTAKVTAGELSACCQRSIANKCNRIRFNMTDSGMAFQGLDSTGQRLVDKKFGSGSSTPGNRNDKIIGKYRIPNVSHPPRSRLQIEEDIDDTKSIVAPLPVIKCLSKIQNLSSPGSLIQIYYEQGKPLKIRSPISNYGEQVYYIKNCADAK